MVFNMNKRNISYYKRIAKQFNKLSEICYNTREIVGTCLYCPLYEINKAKCKINEPCNIESIDEKIVTDLVTIRERIYG